MASNLLCSCHRIHRAGRLVTRLYERAIADSGSSLTPQQFAVLAALAEVEAMTASELTEVVGADRSTLTRALERLDASGLVAGVPGSDRRERRFSVTAAGRSEFEVAVAGWRRAEGAMRRAMGPEKVAQLWDLLEEAEVATTTYMQKKTR
ncbi:MarR family winged helix-turn-helix transcriptional regulator [Stappia indica]|uniref:Transcriptional regulator, MarR family n=1 Tax=Stappia indica TaxID=538381 RepID=A0A285STU9_9HYPH|nr:MarR family transcriptional regulator [Stappia indica]SOC09825.1 transcriptional regulator, MarR family [Stappia indica]